MPSVIKPNIFNLIGGTKSGFIGKYYRYVAVLCKSIVSYLIKLCPCFATEVDGQSKFSIEEVDTFDKVTYDVKGAQANLQYEYFDDYPQGN